jgi:hypothetical protein
MLSLKSNATFTAPHQPDHVNGFFQFSNRFPWYADWTNHGINRFPERTRAQSQHNPPPADEGDFVKVETNGLLYHKHCSFIEKYYRKLLLRGYCL